MLDKTFVHFFMAFVAIIAGAFGVLMIAGIHAEGVEPTEQVANP